MERRGHVPIGFPQRQARPEAKTRTFHEKVEMPSDPNGRLADFLFKVVVIGDSCVGKSALLQRFADDYFDEKYVSTIGIDFKTCLIQIEPQQLVKLHAWDCAGQERFRAITRTYYRGVAGVLIVFDVGQHLSFDHVQEWLDEVDRVCPDRPVILLVGNKVDVQHRAVTTEIAQKYATKHDLLYFETSAKNGANVERAFREMVERLVVEAKKKGPPTTTTRMMDVGNIAEKRDGGGGGTCC